MKKRPPLQFLKATALVLGLTAALLALLEGGARIYELSHKESPVDFDGGFTGLSRIFIPKPGHESVQTVNPQKSLIFAPQEFATKKKPGTFRVVFLGESSVNNLNSYLRGMAQKLQEELAPRFQSVEIINAGAVSYGSQRLVLVANEMLSYEPDLFLVYIGHNEFEEAEQFHVISPERAPYIRAAFHSALIRVSSDLWLRFQVRRLQQQLTDRPKLDRASFYHSTQRDLDERMEAFRKNLEHILAMCKFGGIPAIVGTVPSNLLRPVIPPSFAYRYDAVLALAKFDQENAGKLGMEALAHIPGRHQSSAAENAIIRATAKQFSFPLADVEKAIVAAEPHHLPGETLFKDHCHLNDNGNKILIHEFLRTFETTWKN